MSIATLDGTEQTGGSPRPIAVAHRVPTMARLHAMSAQRSRVEPEKWNGTVIPTGASVAELVDATARTDATAWAAIVALGRERSDAAFEALERLSRAADAEARWRDALRDSSQHVVRTACEIVGRRRLHRAHDAEHDAALDTLVEVAALCVAHGVDRLLTRDRDFSLFPELLTENPLD